MPRLAFAEAATAFADGVDLVGPHDWTLPALGTWTVRDLVGHTLRAVTTVEQYLAGGAAEADVATPEDYVRAVLSAPEVHAAVEARGREAGESLGPNPAIVVRTTVDRVLALVAAAPDDALVTTPAGGMQLVDYLPTRVLELVVHQIDLADALGTTPAIPAWPLQLAVTTLANLADRAGELDLIRGLTGRRPLPSGYNVLR